MTARSPRPRVIVIGASAGGIEALTNLVRGLGSDIPVPIVVVMHISEQSILPAILARAGHLPATHAQDGEVPLPGHVYVAPPGHHLVIEDRRLRLTHDPRENGHRPGIDPLFRSAARTWRERVVGVILSGQLDDGVAGSFAIKTRGGIVVVQEPSDAAAPSMPLHALQLVDVDYRLPAVEIGPLLMELANGGTMAMQKKDNRRNGNGKNSKADEILRASIGANKIGRSNRSSPPVNPEEDPLRCPDCSGPLYRVQNGELTQWRCREGHVFSPESLNGAQSEALERALWLAVRTMKERALIDRMVGARAQANTSRTRANERAHATERDVELLQEILQRI